jgi:hypothetical protein
MCDKEQKYCSSATQTFLFLTEVNTKRRIVLWIEYALQCVFHYWYFNKNLTFWSGKTAEKNIVATNQWFFYFTFVESNPVPLRKIQYMSKYLKRKREKNSIILSTQRCSDQFLPVPAAESVRNWMKKRSQKVKSKLNYIFLIVQSIILIHQLLLPSYRDSLMK